MPNTKTNVINNFGMPKWDLICDRKGYSSIITETIGLTSGVIRESGEINKKNKEKEIKNTRGKK
jgi:hypothetical protein